MELYSGRSHSDTVAAFSPLARRRMPSLNSVARFINRLCSDAALGASAGSLAL